MCDYSCHLLALMSVFVHPDLQGSQARAISNGYSSPTQRSPDGPPRPSTPESPEILRELRRYAASTDEDMAGTPGGLPSPLDMSSGATSDSQHYQSGDLRDDVPAAAASEVRGNKRKLSANSSKQFGSKRASAAGRYPGTSLGSGGSYPQAGLTSSSSMMGNMGHMTHPYHMGGGGGSSSFLQNTGQALGDLQAMFPSAASDLLGQGNGHLPPTVPSCSSLSSVYSSTGPAVSSASAPSSSSSSSSSLAQGSLPPYLMNPSMAGLLSPGYSLNYGGSEPRMYSNPPGGFPSSGPGSYSGPRSSLLGMALSQADGLLAGETDHSSSDDDVIEVMGQ